MNTVKNNPIQLKFQYDAGPDVPPPHYYQYELELQETTEGLQATYSIKYLHREDLTEEEIMDEGFTLEDDWSCNELLPNIWSDALKAQLVEHPLDTAHVNGKSGSVLHVESFGGVPPFRGEVASVDDWSYFLQEVIQALLEVSEQELPFVLKYLEVENKQIHREVTLEASFVSRTIMVTSKKEDKPKRDKKIAWKRLPEIMQQVFLPEYDYEKALVELPTRSGTYIDTGEGLWFEWGKSLIEPKGETSSLLKLKSTIKQLAAKEES